MKSRIALIAASLIAFYTAAGYLTAFHFSRELIRAEMQQQIHNRETEVSLASFTFTREEWKRLQINQREFMVDGEMYDIKSYSECENRVCVTAFRDDKETGLIYSLAGFIHENDSGKKNSTTVFLLRFLGEKFISDEAIAFKEYPLSLNMSVQAVLRPVSYPYHRSVFSPPDFMQG